MKEIIAVINQKGGVGKSTTAWAIAASLNKRGFSALAVDLDAQCNLTYTLDADNTGLTSADILANGSLADGVIQRTKQGDVIPGSPSLSGADAIITETGKEYRLRESLVKITDDYDYIIIDTPPALGIITVNALTAATTAVIPAGADIYSLQGIERLADTIAAVKKYCNPQLKISGIVLTRFSSRSIISREIAELTEQTARILGTKVFAASIRECTAIKEAQAVRQSIFDYAPKSNAAADYDELVSELLAQVV